MTSQMFVKLLSSTKTPWAYVHSVAGHAYWIGAFDAYSVGQVTITCVATELVAGLIQR